MVDADFDLFGFVLDEGKVAVGYEPDHLFAGDHFGEFLLRIMHVAKTNFKLVVQLFRTAFQVFGPPAFYIVDGFECFFETLARTLFYLAQGFFGRRDAVNNILTLRSQKQKSFIGFCQFFEREHIDRAEIFQFFAQIVG